MATARPMRISENECRFNTKRDQAMRKTNGMNKTPQNGFISKIKNPRKTVSETWRETLMKKFSA